MLKKYVSVNYKKMLREPEGELKYPFIVPGSVYSNQLWDWDCWLTNIALRQFVKDDISEYEKGCVLNFLTHIDKKGQIPIWLTSNSHIPDATKLYNERNNIHKPCLAQHAAFIVKNNNEDAEWLRPYFQRLIRFVECYINNFRHSNGLYYWRNDSAIGVDNDPCTFYRPENSSASIYLNCMMYKEIEALCYIGKLLDMDMTVYLEEKEHL